MKVPMKDEVLGEPMLGGVLGGLGSLGAWLVRAALPHAPRDLWWLL